MSLEAGDLVDRYRIVARLGAGGMGEVYRAHDTRLQRDIALKILHPDPGSGSGSPTGGAARLLREARSVAALEHPNVITIHDVGEITEPESLRGTPYIAMELIKGRSLREYMLGPTVPLADRIGWLTGAAQGLAAAHRAGIVHRDVKPENVMVRDDGVVKVLDFGIAKRSYPTTSVDPTSSTEAQLLPQLSTQGVVVGTPYYMAPEQMRSETLDGRADQFSWGVVAYELLAGKPPWTLGGDALQLVSEVLSARASPPSIVNPEIPQYLDAIILRALAKSRDDRFPSMNAVVDSLSAATMPPSFRSLPPQASPFARTESLFPVAQGAPSGPMSQPLPPIAPVAPTLGSATVGTKSARWGWWALGLAVFSTVVALAQTTYRRRTEPGQAMSAASASSATAPPPGDAPGARSQIPAATSAYRAAMMALRDADVERGTRELDEALHADPSFAAAHLRYALSGTPPLGDGERGHLQEATRLRTLLDAHDQILVQAFAPLSSAPGDLVETEKRLTEAVARAPSDADFALQLCRARNGLERPDAVETCRRASELDPGAAAPLKGLATAQVRSGDVRGALASFEACLRDFPLATSCLLPLSQLQAFEGNCDAAMAAARRLVSADPEAPFSYDVLAESLMGAGQPIESVRAALDEKHTRLPAADAKLAKTQDEALLAIRTGDFARADQQLRAWDDAVATSQSLAAHSMITSDRILLALEQGHAKDAATLAAAFLARRAAWTEEADDSESIFFDGVLYRTGAITKEDFVQRRTKWLAVRKAQPRASQLGFVWIAAYAEPAMTAADAREALDVLPGYLPLPDPMMRSPDYELPIGHAYHLAGRDSEAIPYLTRAVKACVGREAPFEQTWASLALGQALENLQETSAACAAYAVVRQRWKAAPSSVSARQANARLLALRCAP